MEENGNMHGRDGDEKYLVTFIYGIRKSEKGVKVQAIGGKERMEVSDGGKWKYAK